MSLHALARIPALKRSALLAVLIVVCAAPSLAAAGPPELEDPRYALCKADPKIPDRPPQNPAAYKLGSIEVTADRVEVLEENVSTFVGGVSLVREQQAVVADLLTYERGQAVIEAEGHLLLWDPALFWSGKYGRLDLANDRAHLEYGEYRLLQRRGRGGARIIKLDTRENVTQLKDVDYTTCGGKTPDWQLAAKRMKLDHNEEWGEAEHVVLRVRETPVFYLPYITFPISDKRKTGFLPPTVGSTSESGFDLSTPYYWNIAPQHDATFQPRILSNRGVMLGGQYRYLLQSGGGELDFEYLPSDAGFEDESRSLVAFTHEQDFARRRGHAFLTYNRVSDSEYFEDFGSNLAVRSTRYLPQRADISYRGDYFNIFGRLQGFQTVDSTIPVENRPYDRLPQIFFSTRLPARDREINLEFFGQATYFDRDEGVIGGRIDLKPVISYPVHGAGGFLVPRVSLEHTQYYLENTAGADNRPSRTLPIVSLDSGLVFERDLDFAALPAVQTFEPRIFYLYVPEQDQDDLPVFDTGQYDISFAQLFRENRFSGPDRLGDANQTAVAVTSRIINRYTGWEHLRASVGQIFYFEDRRVNLPTDGADTVSVSNFLAELTTRLPNGLSARGDLFLDPNDGTVEKGLIGLRYGPDPDTIVNADYRINRNIRGLGDTLIEQTDLAFRWPLDPNWSVIGKWTYSLDVEDTVEVAGGFEYNSCCWGVRTVARRFVSSDTGEFDNAFFVQIELKGLAGFGRSTTSYLKRSIPGYENEF
ncbi:MAG: LPS-assembly protein LptD [Chromatiales bacterium]